MSLREEIMNLANLYEDEADRIINKVLDAAVEAIDECHVEALTHQQDEYRDSAVEAIQRLKEGK